MTRFDPTAEPGQRNPCEGPRVDWARQAWDRDFIPVCQTCGLLVEGDQHTDQGWPLSEIYVHRHSHVWREVAWDKSNGWHPRYRCEVCGDEVQDLAASPMWHNPDAPAA